MVENTRHEDWMDELQRRSWELELLVSGFSIFLLAQTPPQIDVLAQRLLSMGWWGFASYVLIVVPAAALRTLVLILVLSLVVHLLLRGVWIALIGLRSVYADENVDTQGRRFDSSRAIVKLDELASLMFSFSFLIVGSVFSFVLFFLAWGVLTGSAENNYRAGRHDIATALAIPALVLTVSALVWLLNHLSAGRLARGRFLRRLQAGTDYLLSRLTLSFIYRPIYDILARKTKWFKPALWLCFAVSLVANFEKRTLAGQFRGHYGQSVQTVMYENLRPKNAYVQGFTIQSDVIDEDAVRLFLETRGRTLATARATCEGFGELEDKLGYSLFGVSLAAETLDEEESKQVVKCLADQFRILLDDKEVEGLSFLHYRHPETRQVGLLTYVPLPRTTGGLHELAIKVRGRPGDGSRSFFTATRIPFWRAGAAQGPKEP